MFRSCTCPSCKIPRAVRTVLIPILIPYATDPANDARSVLRSMTCTGAFAEFNLLATTTRQAVSHDTKVKVLSMCAGQQGAGAGAGAGGVVGRGRMQEEVEEPQLQQLQAMQGALQMS